MKMIGSNFVRFTADDGAMLTVQHDNRGEPYRQGIQISLEFGDGEYGGHLFLEDREARCLRDLLNRLYPASPTLTEPTEGR